MYYFWKLPASNPTTICRVGFANYRRWSRLMVDLRRWSRLIVKLQEVGQADGGSTGGGAG